MSGAARGSGRPKSLGVGHRQLPVVGRRQFLGGALAGVVAYAAPPVLRPVHAQGSLDVTALGDGFSVVSGAGGNVLVLATDEGQVLVDSGGMAGRAGLGEALAALPGAGRVGTLFNTHWHLDQVGSNEAFGMAGATIIAHEKTRAHLSTPYYLPAEERFQPALPEPAWPTQSFYTTGSTTAGGRAVEYGYLLEAHTDGDIYVRFPEANIIAVGDAVSPVRDPVLDWFGGGWLGGRVDSLALLLDLGDAATRFVPSYGPVIGRAEVQAEHDLMLELFDRMVELVRKGMSAEDILHAGGMDGLGRTFDDPMAFLYAAHKGMWANHNKLMPDIV